MADLFKFLSTNAPAALTFSVAILIVGVTISILYAVAFAQGRSVSFWPPSIGSRPNSAAVGEAARADKANASGNVTQHLKRKTPLSTGAPSYWALPGNPIRLSRRSMAERMQPCTKPKILKRTLSSQRCSGVDWLRTRRRGNYFSRSNGRQRFSNIATL